MADENQGDMSVSEAGHKGGQRVRELIEEGRETEGTRSDDTSNEMEDEREM